MKKTYKILIILLIIFSLCAGLVWWQWGNIKAVYYWYKYSDSDIDKLMNESFTEVESYLEENPQYQVRPYNPLEAELHQAGIINDEELVSLITEQTTIKEMFGTELELDENKEITIVETGEKLNTETITQLKQEVSSTKKPLDDKTPPSDTGEKTPPSDTGEKTPPSNTDDKTPPSDTGDKTPPSDTDDKTPPSDTDDKTPPSDTDDKTPGQPQNTELSECVAQVYVIKSRFVTELDIIYNAAFAEYKALWYDMTDAERTAKKKSLLAEVYPKASALERECDTQINQLLTKLKGLLEKSGESTALVEQIRESYYTEKSLKKAHYLSLLT